MASNNKSAFLWLILIVAIAAFFRLWQISAVPPGLYPDEAMNGNNALEALETGEFKIFYPENNGREGLFINITALSLKIFGNKPWAIRIVSSIFGILTVLGLFLLTKELFKFTCPQKQKAKLKNQNDNSKSKNFNLEKNEIIALLSSFFLATSFWHINFSRIGFRAIMAPFFLVWGEYFLLKVFSLGKTFFLYSNTDAKDEKLKIKNYNLKLKIFIFLGALFYGLGFYSYIAYRATPLLIVILMFGFWWINRKTINNKRFLLLIAGFWLLVVIVIFPLIVYFYNNPQDFLGRTSQISIFSTEHPLKELGKNILLTIGMFWYRGDYNWRHNYSGAPQLWWPIGILFGLGTLISFGKIIQNAKIKIQNDNVKFKNSKFLTVIFNSSFLIFRSIATTVYGFLILWVIIGLAPVVISSEGLPHALRAIIALPAVTLISASGFEWLLSKIRGWLAKQTEKYAKYAQKLNRIKKELMILLFVFFIGILAHTHNQYFLRWANRPDVYYSFNQNYVEIGNYLNSLPKNTLKYVIVNASGVKVSGIPMPSQTVMFITKTYLPKWQQEKNVRYILPENIDWLSDSQRLSESQTVITMLETDPFLRKKLKENIPGLRAESGPGFVILEK